VEQRKQTNKGLRMLNVMKLYDHKDTAYDFIAKEMRKYSRCHFFVSPYDKVEYKGLDMVIISDPNISYSETAIKIPHACKERGIKVIGVHRKDADIAYEYADLIVVTSPLQYLWAKKKYAHIPVIFLPDSIDTMRFQPLETNARRFTPGVFCDARSLEKYKDLFDRLKYVMKVMDENTPYTHIDCLISLDEYDHRHILKAIAFGLPVVARDRDDIHLLIPDEYIIQSDEALKKKLDVLFGDYELRDALGKINRAWCDKIWSWENNMPLWDDVFYYLHHDDLKKVKEIGESCIEAFKKYFVETEHNLKQIADFSRLKIEQHKIIKPNPYEHRILNLILDIQGCSKGFWLADRTCLDALRYGRLESNHLHIGVASENEKYQITEFLDTRSANGIEVHIVVEPEITKTKLMTIHGHIVSVPYPILTYLINKFGYTWRYA
jgi:hypothetical protein